MTPAAPSATSFCLRSSSSPSPQHSLPSTQQQILRSHFSAGLAVSSLLSLHCGVSLTRPANPGSSSPLALFLALLAHPPLPSQPPISTPPSCSVRSYRQPPSPLWIAPAVLRLLPPRCTSSSLPWLIHPCCAAVPCLHCTLSPSTSTPQPDAIILIAVPIFSRSFCFRIVLCSACRPSLRVPGDPNSSHRALSCGACPKSCPRRQIPSFLSPSLSVAITIDRIALTMNAQGLMEIGRASCRERV